MGYAAIAQAIATDCMVRYEAAPSPRPKASSTHRQADPQNSDVDNDSQAFLDSPSPRIWEEPVYLLYIVAEPVENAA
jgi:hypothetical protein